MSAASVIAAISGPRQSTSKRPQPIRHAPNAPPFDPNDSYGNVHTTLSPEQVIPPHFTDRLFLRADAFGLMLQGNYAGNPVQDGGVRITSGRWTGLWIPFLVGANSTPPTMFMSPMMPLYPQDVITAQLTEHAEWGYDDLVVSHEPWNAAENGRTFTPADMVAWGRYVRNEWGFRVVLWRGDRPPTDTPDDVTKAMLDAGLVSFLVWGKEVNTKMSSEEYEQSVQMIIDYTKRQVPIGAHFSADSWRGMGYPQSAPDYIRDWSKYDGVLHLCQQLSGYGPENAGLQDELCPAGLQGAAMYYGRTRVALGAAAGEGGLGPGAPNSRVIDFELQATTQLYGDCTQAYGNLRSWEILCGTRTNPRVPPVSGGCNGNQYPLTGDPL